MRGETEADQIYFIMRGTDNASYIGQGPSSVIWQEVRHVAFENIHNGIEMAVESEVIDLIQSE